jgi:prophage regulatory protein
MSQPKLLPIRVVAERVCMSRSSIYRLVADPTSGFPQPLKVSARRVAFVEGEVDDYVARRIASRDQAGSQAA